MGNPRGERGVGEREERVRESLTLAPRVGPFILCHSSVACVCARFV